jgi:MYXO-CTERM domain-containing protein
VRRAALSALAGLCLLCVPMSAAGWVPLDGNPSPPNLVWTSLPVSWSLNQNGSVDLGFATTEATMLTAFATWSEPPCSAFATNYLGSTTRMPGSDGQNVLGWLESGWYYGGGTIGVTTTAFMSSTALSEADIVFNGVNFTWSTSGGGGSTVDAQSIATHEMGHFLGLDHPPCTMGQTMCAMYSGGIEERTLTTDDIDGVCALYPSGATGCVNDDDCEPGEHCDGGYCVPDPEPGDPCDPCTSHEECGDSDDLCLSGFTDGGMYCGASCGTAADCPGGYDCIDVGGAPTRQCVPGTFDCSNIPDCLTDTDCPEGQVCIDGACVPEPDCYTDGDCPEGEVCRDGVCIPDPSPHLPWCAVCTSHEDCGGPDDLCISGFVDGSSRCGISCDSVWGDCGEGKVCYPFDDAPDQCIPADMDCSSPPEGCVEDSDCPPGQVCSGGVCVAISSFRMVSGCGCSFAGSGPDAGGMALVLAALVCLGLVRRRSRLTGSS